MLITHGISSLFIYDLLKHQNSNYYKSQDPELDNSEWPELLFKNSVE